MSKPLFIAHMSACACAAIVVALLPATTEAAPSDPYTLLESLPSPPSNASEAKAAAQITKSPFGLSAPAYVEFQAKLTAQITTAAGSQASMAGIDMNRMRTDPAYAAEMQSRMESMSTAEKMALVEQMRAAQKASSPTSGAQVALFVAGQRAADQAAQSKIRALMQGALGDAGAKHRAIDADIDAKAKACTPDKTGWPLASCTNPLGDKSIAQHRALEESLLAAERKAFDQARAIAAVELNKGRAVYSSPGVANSPQGAALSAWAAIYLQILHDYGEAIALRAGFWEMAAAHKYTGSVISYISDGATGEVNWPLATPAAARVGL